MFEPSGIKDERLFAECLKTAHVVKYANDRIEGVHDVVAKAKVPIEMETLGAKGLRLRIRTNGHAGAWKDLPAFSAPELRDAAGSGDWTTAGLVHGLMTNGASIERVVADLNAVVLAARQGQAGGDLGGGVRVGVGSTPQCPEPARANLVRRTLGTDDGAWFAQNGS